MNRLIRFLSSKTGFIVIFLVIALLESLILLNVIIEQKKYEKIKPKIL